MEEQIKASGINCIGKSNYSIYELNPEIINNAIIGKS